VEKNKLPENPLDGQKSAENPGGNLNQRVVRGEEKLSDTPGN